jgi:hypothetical protein
MRVLGSRASSLAEELPPHLPSALPSPSAPSPPPRSAQVRTVLEAVCVLLGVPPVVTADPLVPGAHQGGDGQGERRLTCVRMRAHTHTSCHTGAHARHTPATCAPCMRASSHAGKKVESYWEAAKKLLQDPQLIQRLLSFDRDNIPQRIMERVGRKGGCVHAPCGCVRVYERVRVCAGAAGLHGRPRLHPCKRRQGLQASPAPSAAATAVPTPTLAHARMCVCAGLGPCV